MDDPAAREAFGVAEGERVIAMVNVGEPAADPPDRERLPAVDLTKWMP